MLHCGSGAAKRAASGLLALTVLLAAAATGEAADPRLKTSGVGDSVPASSRVESGQMVTARVAGDAVARYSDIILIDVRTHGETLFNGVAGPMHRHIPYVQLDFDHSYDARNERYKLEPNPDFVKAVDLLLGEMKRDRSATLILYCAVGERSAKAAALLTASGFANVYTMVDGFDGDPRGGPNAGWKGAGLPWRTRLAPHQAYKSPAL